MATKPPPERNRQPAESKQPVTGRREENTTTADEQSVIQQLRAPHCRCKACESTYSPPRSPVSWRSTTAPREWTSCAAYQTLTAWIGARSAAPTLELSPAATTAATWLLSLQPEAEPATGASGAAHWVLARKCRPHLPVRRPHLAVQGRDAPPPRGAVSADRRLPYARIPNSHSTLLNHPTTAGLRIQAELHRILGSSSAQRSATVRHW